MLNVATDYITKFFVDRDKNRKMDFIMEQNKNNIVNSYSVKEDLRKLRKLTEELDFKEQQVNELTETYRNLFNSLWNGIVILKKEGNEFKIKKINNSAKHINGFSNDCIWKPIDKCIYDNKFLEKIETVYNTNVTQKIVIKDYKNNNKDLNYYFECVIYKLSTDDIVIIFEDKTIEVIRYQLNKKREKMLKCCLTTSKYLSKKTITKEDIKNILTNLKISTDVSKAYIYQNKNENGAKLYKTTDNCKVLDYISFEKLTELGNTLSLGHYVCDDTISKNSNEMCFFREYNIKSFCVVPIFINEVWWGFLGLEDKHEVRNWSFDDINILITIADMLGVLINRINEA